MSAQAEAQRCPACSELALEAVEYEVTCTECSYTRSPDPHEQYEAQRMEEALDYTCADDPLKGLI